MTYTGLIGKTSKRGKFNTRLTQIIDWLGKEFDGVVSFSFSKFNIKLKIVHYKNGKLTDCIR